MGLAALAALVVAGCGTSNAPDPTVVIEDFELYTHCGIQEAKIGDTFYAASPVLDDGSGNPPAGWGNPSQVGTMTVPSDGTARFSAPGGLEADFEVRPGATNWSLICS
jgi:hypothetical protein